MRARVTIGFDFSSDRLKKWRRNFEPITEWSNHRAVFNWVSKVISELLWFCITSLSDWFKVLESFFQPIRSESKTNRCLRVHIFPRFVSATCNYFEFWLVYWIVSVLFDWPKLLLWFWFYDTQLKLALNQRISLITFDIQLKTALYERKKIDSRNIHVQYTDIMRL